MRSKAIRVCAGLIAISTLAACGGGKNESADSGHGIPSGPIVIGMPIALTGPINAYDGNTLTGVRLAADEINTKGGIKGHKIKVITADTASNIAQGTAAAQDVVNEGAQFLVPTIDYNYGRAAARIGAKRGLIVLGAADDTRFGKSLGDNVFNLGTGGPTQGAALAEYAYTTLKWRKAYVLQDTGLAAQKATCEVGFSGAFRAHGGRVTKDSFQQASESAVVSAVSRVKAAAAKVDGVMLCGYPPQGATAIRKLRAAGVTAPLLLSTGFDGNFWTPAVPDLRKTYSISFAAVTPGQAKDPEAAKAFKAAEKADKPVTQSLAFLTGYSAVQTIVDAVEATNSTSAEKIRPYLEAYKNHKLAIGRTTWTGECHARAGGQMVIARFVKGTERTCRNRHPVQAPPERVC
ncbi:Leu/Ile/Val-binding protein [Streptomyces antimycoticus]